MRALLIVLALLASSPALAGPAILHTVTGWSPARITGSYFVAWRESAYGVTLNGANVSAWASRAPATSTVTQGTAGAQPAFSAAGGPLSRAMIDFTAGSRYFADESIANGATDLYSVQVIKVGSSGAYRNVYEKVSTVGPPQFWYRANNDVEINGGNGVIYAPGAGWILVEALHTDATNRTESWKNGVSQGVSTLGTAFTITDPLAISRFNRAGVNNFVGYIVGEIFMGRAPTATEQSLIQQYFRIRYNLW